MAQIGKAADSAGNARPGRQQMDVFFDALAESSNVAASARAAGVSSNAMYRERRRDPAFAARWHEALCEGFARLSAGGRLACLDAACRARVRQDADGRGMGARLTVLPLCAKILGAVSQGLSGWFDGAALRVDLDKVPALAEDRMALWREVSAADWLTADEKKALLGVT